MTLSFMKRFCKTLLLLVIICLFVPKVYFYFSLKVQTNSYLNKSNQKDALDNRITNDIDAQWLAKMENKYSLRAKVIDETCKKYQINVSSNVILQHGEASPKLLFDTYFKFGYCAVMKVGSSTLANHLRSLMTTQVRPDRFDEPFVEHWREQQMQKFFKVPPALIQKGWTINDNYTAIQKIMFTNFLQEKRYLLFTFVRHPFERLVSAYKSKVLGRGYISSNDKYLIRRVKSFPDFINLVLKQHYENNFINLHWKRFSDKCQHCAISYDVIGRMETFEEDLKYIVLKLGLENLLPIETITTLRKNRSDQKKSLKHKDRTKKSLEYFSELEKSQIKELYNIYQIDFEMFGYDASDYLTLS